MRKRTECGFLTKWLVYTLVVSVTTLYLPLGHFSTAMAADAAKSVYLFGFTKDGETPTTELVSSAESFFKESLGGDEAFSLITPGKAKRALSGDSEEAFKSLKSKVRDQDFDKKFMDQLGKVGSALKADYLVMGVFKSGADESTLYTLVYAVKGGKLYQASETAYPNDGTKGVKKANRGAYNDTVTVMSEGKGEKKLAAGFVLGAAKAEAKAEAAPVAAPAAPVEKKAEPAPAPTAVVGPVNLDVDSAILLSGDDAKKAREDTNSEESIAPMKVTPLYKQWWLWTIVGAVAIGGGITAGVLLAPDNKAKSSRVDLSGIKF